MPPRPRGSRIWYTPNVEPETSVTSRLSRGRAKQRMIASAPGPGERGSPYQRRGKRDANVSNGLRSALEKGGVMTRTSWMLSVLAATVLAVPASAQTSVDRTVPFELDKWFEPDVKEGPVTLHRIPLERGGGGLKAHVTGGETEYRVPVKVEIEYSNAASSDWRGVFRISWVDESGETIDGYNGSHELEEK